MDAGAATVTPRTRGRVDRPQSVRVVAEVDTGRVIETSQGVGDAVFSADGRFVSVTDDADDTSPVPGR